MRFRQTVTLFCFLVLMFQLLPVRQLGKLLFGNQITEELSHEEALKDAKDIVSFKKDFLPAYPFICPSFISAASCLYIPFDTSLSQLFPGEVQTPPPDC